MIGAHYSNCFYFFREPGTHIEDAVTTQSKEKGQFWHVWIQYVSMWYIYIWYTDVVATVSFDKVIVREHQSGWMSHPVWLRWSNVSNCSLCPCPSNSFKLHTTYASDSICQKRSVTFWIFLVKCCHFEGKISMLSFIQPSDASALMLFRVVGSRESSESNTEVHSLIQRGWGKGDSGRS